VIAKHDPVCVNVCERERVTKRAEREKESVCVRVNPVYLYICSGVCMCVYVRVCVGVWVRVHACVCVCVFVRVRMSQAPAIIQSSPHTILHLCGRV